MKKDRLLAEFIGSLLLLLIVVGSGIMGEKLAAGNTAIALLANAIATGAGLFFLISVFGPVSGAHFNPAVSTYFWIRGELCKKSWFSYIMVQILGSVAGVGLAHFIFALPLLQVSTHLRDGMPQMVSELVATMGLLFAIVGFSRFHPTKVPLGVAAYIVGAYWFTSSTSFANPAVTVARSLTDTFAGIAPQSLLGFLVAQMVAVVLFLVIEGAIFNKPEVKK